MLAGIFALVFVGGWVELLLRHGLKEGVRISLILWSGNVIPFGLLFLAFAFGVVGGKALEQR